MKLPYITLAVIAIAGLLLIPTIKDTQKVNAAEKEVAAVRERALTYNDFTVTNEEKEAPVFEEIKKVERNYNYQSPYDFETLKSINSDIVGWIKIEDTPIDYPILFDGTDQYLHISLRGETTPSGSIYVDAAADNALQESINIIYGHHMKDGSMFAAIDDYSYEEFWNSHQKISIYMEDKEINLKPEFCVVGKSDSTLRNIYNLNTLEAFLDDKIITQGEIPKEYRDLYVLVTCNYTGDNYRTYLFCEKE